MVTRFLIFIAICFSCSLAGPLFEKWRVVGGQDATDGQFPYMVSLQASWVGHMCGGSILNNYWILTAAHCVNGMDPNDYQILVGTSVLSTGGQKYDVEVIIVHEEWNDMTIENDIALLKLASPISFSDEVQLIAIDPNFVEEEETVLSGWGMLEFNGTTPDNLKFLRQNTILNKQCQDAYEQDTIFESQLCTLSPKGQGSCRMDSGGPLAKDGKLVGVVSWGYRCAEGKPDVYTRVSTYLGWINTKTGQFH